VNIEDRILFEDNHLLIFNKLPGEISQQDITGDQSLLDVLKNYIKEKYRKPGNVYLGLPHRLDRPTSGAIIFTKTSKALSRLTKEFKEKNIKKTYWAVTKNEMPENADTLTHFLVRNSKQNKSYAHDQQVKDSKKAILHYELIKKSDKYFLYAINLETGRHHQIRAQFSKLNCPIKGDLKYNFPRSNNDGGIHLHARKIEFVHPVKKVDLEIIAPTPEDTLWNYFDNE
jgi:23S rRNA pseudouridine1911/1915/1917 synthase